MIKQSRPFLDQDQIDYLRAQSNVRGPVYSSMAQEAFQLIMAVGKAHRFPVRTMAMGMLLFHKTYLYNDPVNLQPMLVAMACLFVASKTEDTPRRAREIISTWFALKNPQNTSTSSIEAYRVKILGLERQILETVGFDFRVRHPHKYVVKMGKLLNASQEVCRLAWTIATDAYLTDAPLKLPSHVIAFASIVLAAKFRDPSLFPLDSKKMLIPRYHVDLALLDLLDFYIHYLGSSLLGREINEVTTFMTIRIGINKELQALREKRNEQSDSTKFEGLMVRDPRLSDRGTVRYILDWEREHVEGELVV